MKLSLFCPFGSYLLARSPHVEKIVPPLFQMWGYKKFLLVRVRIWLKPVGSHSGRGGFNALGDIRCECGYRGRSTESIESSG